MPRRPFKLLTLNKKLLESRAFLKRINSTRNREKLKALLFEATPQNLLTLESLIIAWFDPDQELPFDNKAYKKLKRSGFWEFLKKNFKPKIKHSLAQSKKLLLKIVPVLRIFTQNSLAE